MVSFLAFKQWDEWKKIERIPLSTNTRWIEEPFPTVTLYSDSEDSPLSKCNDQQQWLLISESFLLCLFDRHGSKNWLLSNREGHTQIAIHPAPAEPTKFRSICLLVAHPPAGTGITFFPSALHREFCSLRSVPQTQAPNAKSHTSFQWVCKPALPICT